MRKYQISGGWLKQEIILGVLVEVETSDQRGLALSLVGEREKSESWVHASDPRRYYYLPEPFIAFSILAQESRRVTVRLKQIRSSVESGSMQKYPCRSN